VVPCNDGSSTRHHRDGVVHHTQADAQGDTEHVDGKTSGELWWSKWRPPTGFDRRPVYGFSSVAPLGPVAASTLDGYFRAASAREIGQRRPSSRPLGQFSPFAMSVTQGGARLR